MTKYETNNYMHKIGFESKYCIESREQEESVENFYNMERTMKLTIKLEWRYVLIVKWELRHQY